MVLTFFISLLLFLIEGMTTTMPIAVGGTMFCNQEQRSTTIRIDSKTSSRVDKANRTNESTRDLIPVGKASTQTQDNLYSRSLRWRNIGPANMTGRIAAIEALSTDYRHVLVASASGGVFRSTNAGITWDAIFDNSEGAGSIGAVAMFEPNPKIIWVGTGEAANRNSSGWGNGLFKTIDGGKTWKNVGLANTHHIAEIALHPTNPDIAYVASPGHLWGYSGDRGLFKTTDGGETWTKLGASDGNADDSADGGLPNDGKIGATEVILDPRDPDVIYAGMYHRLRQPATMQSGGPGGGIFKSEDGGESWRRLSTGLAKGDSGMIDLSICLSDPDVIVAAYEADENIPFDEKKPTWENTPGTGIYISEDAGETWKWILRTNTRPFYHGQVQIDPNDKNRIFSVGRTFEVTVDGGKTWRTKWWGGGGDDHDFWIDPKDSSIFYCATDQGAYLTVDNGKNVLSFDNMAIGQYYKIGVDMRDPYWVIGGLQDNALWMGPSNSREARGILNMHNTWLGEGDGFAGLIDPTDHRIAYLVNHVGFVLRLDIETRKPTFITPTPETVLNFADFANPDYIEEKTEYTIEPGEMWFGYGRPNRPLMPPHFRFNWNSPLTMSPSNPRVLYFAGNHLFKSIDRGNHWHIISPDLTNNDPKLRNPSKQGGLTRSVTGGENHFTIFTVRESPLDPALVWAGTDDGNLHVTRDGGGSWRNVRDNLPGLTGEFWVGRVEPSNHHVGTTYVVVDNHRLDDMNPHVFVTRDFGASFTDITGNLPDGIGSYVIIEDPVNQNLLFVGTEFGVYASIEGGNNWFKLSSGMPNVAVRDLLIHPRDPDLVAGTHGRSIWILDDITPLRQLTTKVTDSAVHAFENDVATQWVRINLGRKQSSFLFKGANPPAGGAINFWLKDEPHEDVEIQVSEFAGDRVAKIGSGRRRGRGNRPTSQYQAGINRVFWDLRFPSTAAERSAMKERLVRAIEALENRVVDAELTKLLGELQLRLENADSDRALNRVRDRLVKDFNGYATGTPLFGSRIGSQKAAAGTYRIQVTANGETHESTITVREDPILQERINR